MNCEIEVEIFKKLYIKRHSTNIFLFILTREMSVASTGRLHLCHVEFLILKFKKNKKISYTRIYNKVFSLVDFSQHLYVLMGKE